ncbi:hypothetical protein GLP59_15330 [Sulfitobacter sp. M220]|uniref:hypothetical protein n=1 Tax=Sulfitobacter sp. M220 TaxID=2675333 RepID=UPI001F198F10|nr:hypothetical protein [Sulfitobacter sp. M220]MCF7778984.1 hypothetical protein [Sulfitobacter sp. M220]MCF7779000.1 hypothetical protein [Sulfitobacter sp. M220]
MGKVSVREAVKHYQVSRPTLMKHLKKGKLSANKDDQGTWEIDQSELTRVYKSRKMNDHVDQSNFPTLNNSINSNENSLLQVKLDAAMETIERLEADKADWKQQAQSLARLMPPEGAGEGPRRSLWSRIKGG